MTGSAKQSRVAGGTLDCFVASLLAMTKKRRHRCLPSYSQFAIRSLPQPSRRVPEQGVDHAGLRGEVAAQRLRSAVLARDLVEQPLDPRAVAVDLLAQDAVGA